MNPSPLSSSSGAVAPFFAFFCCFAAIVMAVAWSWNVYQHRSAAQALPLSAYTAGGGPVQASVSVPEELTSGAGMGPHPQATESRDAESADVLASVTIGLPDALAPAQVVIPAIPTISMTQAAVLRRVRAPMPDQGERHARIIPASLPSGRPPQADTGGHRNPRIAIIIDDMGLAVKNSRRVVDLPSGLTLSYLPYAENLQAQVDEAHAKGHEIMLHLPMEPFDRAMYPGPGALMASLSANDLRERLRANLSAFRGYVGINNHMGSRLTSAPAAMQMVMAEIGNQGVYFVDSWTSPRSVAYETAASFDIPRGRRDVFLDHFEGEDPVWTALKQAEYLARRHGSAVVIGHPKHDTINVLRAWLPGAMARGVEIVPMSKLVYRGTVEKDPVLLADAARRAKGTAQRMARLIPASGE